MTEAELLAERNTLARQLADLRDEMDSLREELHDAQNIAAQWSQWAESHADELNTDEQDKYEEMLTDSQILIDKAKDYWYDIGYANALRELRNHISEVIGAWAEKQGIDLSG